ncbi:MAG: MFS transporter [Chloroflexi bacterium]|nr:MFS transporter [Chloroflexota bacterium]
MTPPRPRSRPRLAAVARFRGWRALRHHNYRLFFAGQLVSLIGTWMQSVAQGWLVLQLTGDPVYLGLVAAAQFTPVLVLGLFGGVIADGLPKRRTLIFTQAAAMVLALVLFGLTVTDNVGVGQVLGLAFLLGCVNAIDMPTRQAFAVEMVGRDDIGNAVALNSAVFNSARVLGPAIAGLTIGATGVASAFLINGVSFIAVIVAYLRMDGTQLGGPPTLARPTTVAGVMTHLRVGLAFVRATPAVLVPILTIGLVSTFGMNFSVLIPPLAKDVLHVGPTGYGLLMAASGVGSLAASISIAFGRSNRVMLIGVGASLTGAAELVLAASGSFALSLVAMFAAGLGAISMAATANTTIQLTVPDELRGRVMSVYTTVFAGSTPIGGLVAGALASSLGVAEAIGIGALLSLVVGLIVVTWYRRAGLAGLASPPAASTPR